MRNKQHSKKHHWLQITASKWCHWLQIIAFKWCRRLQLEAFCSHHWWLTNDATEYSELELVTPIECFELKPMTPFGCYNLKPMTPYGCCNLKPMTYLECCILRILLVFYFFRQNEKVFQIFKCIVVIRTKILIF